MYILGANIAARRIACKLSQAELAEKAKTSAPMISFIESNRKSPSIGLLVDIADALDASVDELLGRESKRR